MKVNHHQYKKNYMNFVLNSVELDSYGNPINSNSDKAKYILDRFYGEYGFMVERVGKQKAIAEWLSGLALPLPFYYDEIVNLAVEMGSIDPEPSDQLRTKVQNNYWLFMANIIILIEKNHLNS